MYKEKEIKNTIQDATKEMGYSSLREKQEEIVKHFLSGRDTFVNLHIASGKSPTSSIVVVVSPRSAHEVAMDQSL